MNRPEADQPVTLEPRPDINIYVDNTKKNMR